MNNDYSGIEPVSVTEQASEANTNTNIISSLRGAVRRSNPRFENEIAALPSVARNDRVTTLFAFVIVWLLCLHFISPNTRYHVPWYGPLPSTLRSARLRPDRCAGVHIPTILLSVKNRWYGP
jgi:hypothetical protein